jgi:hypothetical protein
MMAMMLVGLIVLQKPCADSVAKLVTSFDGSGSAAMPKPTNLDMPGSGSAGSGSGLIRLPENMTPEQWRQINGDPK